MRTVLARSFLLLQGPPGPFYAMLADGLRRAGHRCYRVNFNGGDWMNWRGPAFNYRGTIEAWPAILADLLEREQVTDIVLFGDCRPVHVVARRIADERATTVHVFEEGYIRPDWVTLERGGVNGNSSLPKDPQVYLQLAESLPPVPDYPPIPASFRVRAREASLYYFANWALAPLFWRYRSHRPHGSFAEMIGWVGRMLRRPQARFRSYLARKRVGARPYFVLPLQLDSDHQIRVHSPFVGMPDAIEAIIASFARYSRAPHVLVVKEHPLDNGLKAWRPIVRQSAARHGAPDRVVFIEHGDTHDLIRTARGVVTVNSTTGTLALAAGKPVAVLGTAVYDLPGVTHQGSLDDFWEHPGTPQLEIYDAFRRVLVAQCLLRGGFSSHAGRAHLVPSAVARLSAASVAAATDEPMAVIKVPA